MFNITSEQLQNIITLAAPFVFIACFIFNMRKEVKPTITKAKANEYQRNLYNMARQNGYEVK